MRNTAEIIEVQRLKGVLFRVQRGLCFCGKPLRHWPRSHTIEHVIPKALGGMLGLGNIVLAHTDCNNRKSDRPPTACELVFLLAVNNRLGVEPMRW